ncbi:MAG: OmpA family protein [Terracidiphilus sp.]
MEQSNSATLHSPPKINIGQPSMNRWEIIVVSTGMEGDTKKDLVLSEARAMVVREYLVENFGFDDSQLKTLGTGKQADTGSDVDWGSIQILIFPSGTEIPVDKLSSSNNSSTIVADRPVQVTAVATHQP